MITARPNPDSARCRRHRSEQGTRHWTRDARRVGPPATLDVGATTPPKEHPTDFPLRLVRNDAPATTSPFPGAQGHELFIATFKTLAQALEAKDPYTSGHSFRVSAYSRALSRELGLTEGEVAEIGLAAELHDIGKIGVPERLLNKRTALLPSEYLKIMEHTVEGERILKPLFHGVPVVLDIVRGHHERMDGRGLPDGRLGNEIPLPTKIVMVADAFDAMTCARWYRPARSVRAALDELRAKAGTQFDPQCVRAFSSTFPTSLSDKRPSRETQSVVYGRGRALGIAAGWA